MGTELSPESFAEATELIVRGKRREAVTSVASVLLGAGAALGLGIVAGPAVGAPAAPVASAAAKGLVGRLAEALVDRTEAMLEAERQYESDAARHRALRSFLADIAQASLRGLRGDVEDLASEQREHFLQTLRFMERNLASREHQEETLRLLREFMARFQGGTSSAANRRPPRDILRRGTATRPAGLRNPATLLTARYEVVDFIESVRPKELEEILGWCEAHELVEVRLFLGPGGVGKTRLFIEAAKRLRDRDWDAGFLPESASEDDERDVLEGTRSTLVVVDYAEARRELPRLLGAVAETRPAVAHKVRVALVARDVGDWWRLLLGLDAPVTDLLNARQPLALRPEDLSLEVRQEVFESYARVFARKLENPSPNAVPDLSNARFGRTLYVAMAALAAVDGGNLPPDKLLDGTLEHERRYIKLHYFGDRSPDLRDQADFLNRAMRLLAAAALRGGLPTREETQAVSKRVDGPVEERTPHALRVLHDLYGAAAADAAKPTADRSYLRALEPDLLGEELVAQVLGHIETPANYLLQVFDDAATLSVRHGLIVLGRLGSQGADERSQRWIASVLDADVSSRALPTLEAALALTGETAHAPLGQVLHEALKREGTTDLARKIEPLVPWRTIALREVGDWATQRVLLDLTGVALTERATLALTRGKRLNDLGRHEEALDTTEEAVRLYRTLANSRPDAHLSDLAMSLNNLAVVLDALNRHEEALDATEEAVRLCCTLVDSHPDAHLSDLAMSLSNRGLMLYRLGRVDDALDAAEKAARQYGALAAAGGTFHVSDYAGCVMNLGMMLAAVGNHEGALAITELGVQAWRTLADEQPDAHLPDFAESLKCLSARLSAAGRHQDALEASEEAVRLFHSLVAVRPDPFTSPLAGSLINLGMMLAAAGNHEKALAATEQAVGYCRTLASAHPSSCLPDLAMSLNNLGNALSGMGKHDSALAATQEAVSHYRVLARDRTRTFLPYLAGSLSNLSAKLSAVGRQQDSLEVAEEAVRMSTALAREHPHVFSDDLVSRSADLARRLCALGRSVESSPALREALRQLGTHDDC